MSIETIEEAEERIRKATSLSTMAPGKVEHDGYVLRYSNRKTTPAGRLASVCANWLRFNDEVWLTDGMAAFIVGNEKSSTRATEKLAKMSAFECEIVRTYENGKPCNHRVIRRGDSFGELLEALAVLEPAKSFAWVPQRAGDGWEWAPHANWQENRARDAALTAYRRVLPEGDRKVLCQLARLDDGTGAVLSYRDLSELTGVHRSSVWRSVQRLAGMDLLESVQCVSGEAFRVRNLDEAETQSTKLRVAKHNDPRRKAQNCETRSTPEKSAKLEKHEKQEKLGSPTSRPAQPPVSPPPAGKEENDGAGGLVAGGLPLADVELAASTLETRPMATGSAYRSRLQSMAKEQAYEGKRSFPAFLADDYDQLVQQEGFEPEYLSACLAQDSLAAYATVVDFHREFRRFARREATQQSYWTSTGIQANRLDQFAPQEATGDDLTASEDVPAPEVTPEQDKAAQEAAEREAEQAAREKAEREAETARCLAEAKARKEQEEALEELVRAVWLDVTGEVAPFGSMSARREAGKRLGMRASQLRAVFKVAEQGREAVKAWIHAEILPRMAA